MIAPRHACALFLGVLLGFAARAEAPPEGAVDNELQAAFVAAQESMVAGPQDVSLRDQAVLKLAEGYMYVPMPHAGRILEAMGNRASASMLGMIFSAREDQDDWFVVMDYEDSGYIKDDDAKEWNADDMLDGLKEGTEQTNGERRARGIPEMEIIGWVEKPTYDSTMHRLAWSVSSKDKGVATVGNEGINYNTYALGREGFISMNLVTQLDTIEQRKPIARELLASLQYNDGKRYTDFDSSTDKIAAFGLAALVGGVAAKKLGLLAVIAAFFVKFAKVIAIGAVAVGGAAWKIFKRKPA
jgi:uncharacterized membrane-anchored protein